MRKITGLLAVVAIVGCNDPKVSVDLKGQPAMPAPPRYQIVINTHESTGRNSEAFLLDTERGRVWKYNDFNISTGMGEHFYPLEIIDQEGLMGMTPEKWLSFGEFLKAKRAEKDAKEHE